MAKPHQELIAKEGWVFLAPPCLITAVSLALGWHWAITLFFLLLALFVANFFRNPYRKIPDDPKAVVSPADGKVVAIHQLDDGRHLISIFLNVFNVHINRSPIAGEITEIEYTKGRFLSADKAAASTENERNRLTIRDGDFQMDVVQIAGLIARRIICWSAKGDMVAKGERFGLIRFGSRTDIALPASCRVLVKVGQKIKGGSDILALRE